MVRHHWARDGPVAGVRGVNFSVIKPLNSAIQNLSKAIEHMQKQLQDVDNKRQEQAERLAIVESSVKSAHHRLDTIEKRIL